MPMAFTRVSALRNTEYGTRNTDYVYHYPSNF
jgi:hypothetical protein